MNSRIMIATLGGQPQVVTFALDELFASGENIREVIVIYLSQDGTRVNNALKKLSAEFVDDYYTHLNKPCRFRPITIRDGLTRLNDIQTGEHAVIAFGVLRDLLLEIKKERNQLHVCVSGGRRMMSLLLTAIAQLCFDYHDKLWHIYTPDKFQKRARGGAIMHAQPKDGVHLLPVPLLPLGVQFPALRELATLTDPPQRNLMSDAEREKCQAVWDNLTSRPREVLQLFATGLTPQEVATKLTISLKTVSSHQTPIFNECRNAWALPEKPRLDYHFLREQFGPFF